MAEKNYKIEVKSQDYQQVSMFKSDGCALAHLQVNPKTFGNCQLFTIGYICHIVISKIQGEQLKDLLSVVLQHAGMKHLCLLDINRNNVEKVLELLKPYLVRVVYNQPYLSTNTSKMNTVMVEFDLQQFK